MKTRILQTTLSGIVVLLIVSCGGSPSGMRSCLDGGGYCSGAAPVQQQQTIQSTNSNFACFVAPSANVVNAADIVTLNITASGGYPPYHIWRGVTYPSGEFSSTTSVLGSFNGSSGTITRTAYVDDSRGNVASCSFSLTVQ